MSEIGTRLVPIDRIFGKGRTLARAVSYQSHGVSVRGHAMNAVRKGFKRAVPERALYTSYDLLGIKITPLTISQIIDVFATTIKRDEHCVVASQNLHGILVHSRDGAFRALHECAYVHIDGMPLIWLGRLAGLPLRSEHRTGWIDWILQLMKRAAEEGWRVYYLGAEENVLRRGLQRIRSEYPAINISGHHGFFNSASDSADNRAVIQTIKEYKPRILIVGMGMGRQEKWIMDNLDELSVNCIGTAGACIEYFAGAAPIPPRWLGPMGLEWAYRLASNPRRFAWRYLVEPWLVLGVLLNYAIHKRGKSKS